jgi:putative colanic acid biosysnthesis UDP-glucose lipid carrier transferase
MVIRSKSRSLLQRRSGLVNVLQPLLDGLVIIGVAWFLIKYNIGYLTQDYIIFLLMLMGIVSFMYDRYAIYRTSSSFSHKVFNLFNAWTISFIGLFILGFLAKQTELYSRVFIIELFVLGFVLQCLVHYSVRRLTLGMNKHSQSENVIIVGSGQLANYLEHKISTNPWLNQKVIGNVSIQEEALNKPSAVDSGLKDYKTNNTIKLGKVSELPELIDAHEINTIYIVTPLESSTVLEKLYFVLLDKNVSIHWIPDIFSLRLINHSVREIAGIPVLTLSETPLTGVSKLTKSIEDKVLSFLILLLISPLFLIVALSIKLDSSGPVFFRQKRTGWNGKTFNIWKFRSMYTNQPISSNPQELKQAEKNDPRVTKVGAFIRRTSLDELPQLINVLTGDMSLVGPRPHAVQHDQVYSERVDDYYARNNIKPGMTGLAQVRGYRGETKDIDQMTKRIESDIEYINNWSLWLDLSILVRTVGVFKDTNAY